MNTRTPFALLVTCLLVAGGYVMWQRRAPQPPQPPGPGTTPLLAAALGPDTAVLALELAVDGRPTLTFARPTADDAWAMTAPVHCSAADWVVNDLVIALKGLQQRSTIAIPAGDPAALERLQLGSTPRAMLTVTTADGTNVTLRIGAPLLGDDSTHVQVGTSDTVTVVDHDFGALLQRTTADYCDRQLLRFDPASVAALTITDGTSGRVYRLDRAADTWTFTAPFQAAAQSDTITDLVATLGQLWVRGWVAPPAADAFDPPAVQIEFEAASLQGDPLAVCVQFSSSGPPQDEMLRYVRRCDAPQVGTVDLQTVHACTPDLGRWRTRRIGSAATWAPQRIVLQRPAGDVEFNYGGTGWQLRDGTPADPEAIEGLMAAVRDLQAVSFLEGRAGPGCGLDPADTRIVLTAEDGTTEQLDIGHYTEQVERRLRYVRRGDTVAKVPSSAVAVAFADLGELSDRRIVLLTPDFISRLEVTRVIPHALQPQQLTLARDANDEWTMSGPVERAVDAVATHRLVSAVAPLVALRRLRANSLAEAAFDRPDAELRWTFRAADDSGQVAPPQHVRIVRQQQRLLARRMGDGALFELDSALGTALSAEVLNTALWSYDIDQVTTIRWVRPEGTIALVREHLGWECAQEPDLPIDDARVQRYLEDLLATRTGRYIDYRPVEQTPYPLDSAGHVFEVHSAGGEVESIRLSAQTCPGDPRLVYATRSNRPGVFLVGAGFIQRAALQLDKFEPE